MPLSVVRLKRKRSASSQLALMTSSQHPMNCSRSQLVRYELAHVRISAIRPHWEQSVVSLKYLLLPTYVHLTVAVACWSPSQPFPYRASSELIDRSSGRAETTSHTAHQDSEATTPLVTSRTYLLLSEQGLDTH